MSSALRKQRTGWYLYDWANSAFSSTVVTVFLGPYLSKVASKAAGSGGMLHLLGMDINPASWFPTMVSLSVILQVIVMPFIGAIADASSRKRALLGGTAILGALCTVLLYFLNIDAGNYLFGGLMFVLANMFFGSSIVVYNSFIPYLSQPHERDKFSARGWALGYLGGGILLLLNLFYYLGTEDSGGDTSLAVRVVLCSAGVWWLLFTIPSLRLLPSLPASNNRRTSVLKELTSTFVNMLSYKQTLLFLVAYLFYNDAVQTVIAMASVYGQDELGLPLSALTVAILIVQFVAIGGSLLFERIANATSTKTAIIISIVGWIAVLVAAYGLVRKGHAIDFFILAGIIAIVMGGIQALSRSLFSRLIPKGKEAEYFSFYEVSDKGTSWIGPLLIALMLQWTGSYRPAILSLTILLGIGLLCLAFVNVQQAEAAVHPDVDPV